MRGASKEVGRGKKRLSAAVSLSRPYMSTHIPPACVNGEGYGPEAELYP
jgi:hypothetical protein